MIFRLLEKKKEALGIWAIKHAEGPHAKFWLGFIAFIEASLIPIPPIIIFVPILLASKARKWFYYAVFTAFFSTLGGFLGYIIGFVFFDTAGIWLISAHELQEEFNAISVSFEKYAFVAIFIAALTPIPYEIFAIASGLFKINPLIFIVASFLGRLLRYVIIGYLVKLYGKHVLIALNKYFAQTSLIFIALLVLFVYYFYFFL